MKIYSKSSPNDLAVRNSGFTLLEMVVGIAISSMLILAVFQLMNDFTSLYARLSGISQRDHRRVGLRQILDHDLNSIPVGSPEFEGNKKELFKTTPSREGDDLYLLETRVHYYIETENDKSRLFREWKRTDLHDEFKQRQRLLTADSLSFSYRESSGNWVSRTDEVDKSVQAVRLNWNESKLHILLADWVQISE